MKKVSVGYLIFLCLKFQGTALLRGVGRSRNFRGEIAENDHPQLAEYDIMEVEPVEGTPVDLPAPGEKSAEPTSKVARLRAG